jgi:hypothetical protein
MSAIKSVLFGKKCTWWDERRNETKPDHCPKCKGPLAEIQKENWDQQIWLNADRRNDHEYPIFISWLKRRCFPSLSDARTAFRERTEVQNAS